MSQTWVDFRLVAICCFYESDNDPIRGSIQRWNWLCSLINSKIYGSDTLKRVLHNRMRLIASLNLFCHYIITLRTHSLKYSTPAHFGLWIFIHFPRFLSFIFFIMYLVSFNFISFSIAWNENVGRIGCICCCDHSLEVLYSNKKIYQQICHQNPFGSKLKLANTFELKFTHF